MRCTKYIDCLCWQSRIHHTMQLRSKTKTAEFSYLHAESRIFIIPEGRRRRRCMRQPRTLRSNTLLLVIFNSPSALQPVGPFPNVHSPLKWNCVLPNPGLLLIALGNSARFSLDVRRIVETAYNSLRSPFSAAETVLRMSVRTTLNSRTTKSQCMP